MEKELVLLVGPQGAGKTTWCRERLPQHFRISQDDQGRQGHLELLARAIAMGEPLIVVDRINSLKAQRRRYLDLARQAGYRTRIVWLNVDRQVCLRRCKERTDHPTLAPEEAEKAIALYFRTFQTPSRKEADAWQVIGPPPYYVPVEDLTDRIGTRRHLIVGDVHGCFAELTDLLAQLRFDPDRDVLVSVGDIVDRGPQVRETMEYLFGLPEFHMVLGNHEDKLRRYLEGHNVQVTHGLEQTLASFGGQVPPALAERLADLPLILKVPSGYVVHAGFDPEMPPEEQNRADCLYMRYYGGKTYFDGINGRLWYSLWPREGPRVFFGHIPDLNGPCWDHVVSLDGGCVFGGELKVFDSADGKVHSIKARQAWAAGKLTEEVPISSPEGVRRREEYLASGLLRGDRTDDGQLAIYTYTDQCVYESAWDEITRNSRGHIFDLRTGECVAWPFPKFFNLGENEESLPEKFPWEQAYQICEKMDGWLGVLYRHEGMCKVASRGSFHSSGAVWATHFIRSCDFSCLPREATLCFEIIHPDHQIILDYAGQETLVILAAFNRFTGEEYPRAVVAEWARDIGLPMVPLLGCMSLDDLLRSQKDQQQREGYVIRFADGRRVKVKTEWYLQLARIMANLTPIAIWEVMRGGRVLPEYMLKVPEELRPLAENYRAVLEGQYAQVLLDVEHTAVPILARYGSDRKALAEYLNLHAAELGFRRPAVFLIRDGKYGRLEQLIMARIYPRGNRFVLDPITGDA